MILSFWHSTGCSPSFNTYLVLSSISCLFLTSQRGLFKITTRVSPRIDSLSRVPTKISKKVTDVARTVLLSPFFQKRVSLEKRNWWFLV